MGGLSESAIIMVVMATGLGETLHHSSPNAESFRIKWHAFCLVPPDGGLLVITLFCICFTLSKILLVLQRFRFCGDLDCPDWVLAEISILSKLVTVTWIVHNETRNLIKAVNLSHLEGWYCFEQLTTWLLCTCLDAVMHGSLTLLLPYLFGSSF